MCRPADCVRGAAFVRGGLEYKGGKSAFVGAYMRTNYNIARFCSALRIVSAGRRLQKYSKNAKFYADFTT